MTNEQIDALEAGEELDKLVAEAMGFKVAGKADYWRDDQTGDRIIVKPTILKTFDGKCYFYAPKGSLGWVGPSKPVARPFFNGHDCYALEPVPAYSSDRHPGRPWWDVVEWIKKQGWSVRIATRRNGKYGCEADNATEKAREFQVFMTSHESVTVAVCRTAIKVAMHQSRLDAAQAVAG